MSDQHDRAAAQLGIAHQQGSTFADLADGAGSAGHFGPVHRLDGVHHAVVRLDLFQAFFDRVHRVFGQNQHFGVVRAEALRAQFDLAGAFLTGDIEHPLAKAAQVGAYLQKQGGFADAGFTAEEQQRAFDQPAAQHAVQLAQAGRLVQLPAGFDL
ncbi:MAG: hypothetical protein II879_14165 [Clostridia bacterium]|nr:hypothetical protein [Clostridia bacterium]